jgi:type I restriction enzyme S subunit
MLLMDETMKELKELPAGWRWAQLAEVCKPDRQIVQPESERALLLPYISLEHIESETGRILKEPIEGLEDEGKSTTFLFDKWHILYGKLRPYLNKVALPSFRGRCTTELIPLLPNQDISRDFLAFSLRRPEIVKAAMRGNTGSRMPRTDMDDLLKEKIPLPPLSEQRCIAALLTEQLAAVEQARKAAESQLAAIKDLPVALLSRAFTGAI